MEIIAQKLTHGDAELFITALPGAILNDEKRIHADIMSPSNRDGYQREPIESRFREIGGYIAGEDESSRFTGPVMAQNLVLNSRETLQAKPIDEDGNLVKLSLPDDFHLWEVDGQHRIGGIRHAIQQNQEIRDRLFPVAITTWKEKLKEAVHFWLINTSQKRVATDVAQRIISQLTQVDALRVLVTAQGKDWIKKAIDIIDIINETPSQPWYRRIKVPGTKGTKGRLVSQNAFSKSLKKFLDTAPYSELAPDQQAKLMVRYWRAIERVIPDAFTTPKEYLVQKTIGVEVLNRLAIGVIERARRERGDPVSEDSLELVLRKLLGDGHAFWHGKNGEAAKYGSSNKAINLLVRYFETEKMPSMEVSKIV